MAAWWEDRPRRLAWAAALLPLLVVTACAGGSPGVALVALVAWALVAWACWRWVARLWRDDAVSLDGVSEDRRRLAEQIVASWPEVAERARLSTVSTVERIEDGRRVVRQVKVPPRLLALEDHPVGLSVRVRVPPGLDPARFDQGLTLAAAWAVPSVRVENPNPEPGVVALVARLAPDATQVVSLYPAAGLRGSPGGVPFAVDEDRRLVNARLLESSVLIGGLPGSGKSGTLAALLTGAAQCPNVAMLGLDPKRVELADWRPRCSAIETELDGMTALLRRLVGEMDRRYGWLVRAGKKKVTLDDLPTIPMILLVVDELAEVIASGVERDEKKADAERAQLLRRLVQKGRAAAISVVAATQKPDATTVPTALRDLFSQRIALRTSNFAMTDTILGAHGAGVDAHQLRQKGELWFVTEARPEPVRARALWVRDEECAVWARRTAHLRPRLVLPGDERVSDPAPGPPGRPIEAEVPAGRAPGQRCQSRSDGVAAVDAGIGGGQ